MDGSSFKSLTGWFFRYRPLDFPEHTNHPAFFSYSTFSSSSAGLPIPPVSILSTSPLLSCHSYYKGAQVPPISSTDLLQQKADPRGIHLTNHCLKPLWAHMPRDKDSHELYSALASLGSYLCTDWQAILFLRLKNKKSAVGRFIPRYRSISLSKKFRLNLWDTHKGMSP